MPRLIQVLAVPPAQTDAVVPGQILIALNFIVILGTQNFADRMRLIEAMLQYEPPAGVE